MSDLISRRAAIAVADSSDYIGLSVEDVKKVTDEVVKGLKQLPPAQPEPQWTPVSERSPRENGWYQCTVIVNDLPRTMELFYKNDKWLNNQRICMFNTYDIYGYGYTKEKHKLSYQELISEFDWTENVVAWMQLPEPYKEES